MTTTQTIKTRRKHPSILAKCTAPFASKQGNHVEQEIRLDDPYRQYSPGDVAKGAIHLSFVRPLRITHLVLRLHGFVKVISRAKLPGEEIKYDEKFFAARRGKGRRGMEYFGDGFAKLFEDESVLCGEGRLQGQFEFQFEMVLPSRGMPSNIDFEHGTISYLLSSTVTRPTTIAPTSTLHRKLNVQEIIDIAPIPKPKAQIISLETYHKKKKAKIGTTKKDKSSFDSVGGMQSPVSISLTTEEDPPRSPAPSEVSSASATGSSASSNQIGFVPSPVSNSNAASQAFNTMPTQDKAYAKTELLQGGCLPGDALPIRIEIHHNKPVKSMQGIVITLFRQGRIDTQPPIPLGPAPRKGEKSEFEDYYPRSRTGLGGLSLSSAGSSRSFRQDLNQMFAPILIDPHSLTHVINTSIQAPFDLFPTISCVPGAMISFQYYVEIVVDLRGRVGSQDRMLDHLSLTNMPQHGYGDPRISRYEGTEGISYHSTPGFNYLITDQLRRTKGVIFTRAKVVVGTRDSARRLGKQREERSIPDTGRSPGASVELGRELAPQDEMQYEQHHRTSAIDYSPTTVIAPPEEEELDEKGRLTRAEERLLPSAPPPEAGHSRAIPAPSAPPADNEEDFIRRYGFSAPAYDEPSRQVPRFPGPTPSPHDDKQEFERQRLLTLVSSPNAADEADFEENTPQAPQPSAPVVYQDDVFDVNDPRIPHAEHDEEFAATLDESCTPDGSETNEPRPQHSHNPGNNEVLPIYKR